MLHFQLCFPPYNISYDVIINNYNVICILQVVPTLRMQYLLRLSLYRKMVILLGIAAHIQGLLSICEENAQVTL